MEPEPTVTLPMPEPSASTSIRFLGGSLLVVSAADCSSLAGARAVVAASRSCGAAKEARFFIDGRELREDEAVSQGSELQCILPPDYASVVCASFNDCNLDAELLRSLRHSKLASPLPAQRCLLPLFRQRNVRVVAPAGTGKSTALAIWVVGSVQSTKIGCQALVLTSTREKALQMQACIDELGGSLGVSSCAVIGGVDQLPVCTPQGQGLHTLIGTPFRLYPLVSRGRDSLVRDVSLLAVDDVDELFLDGFADNVAEIYESLRGVSQVSFFSRTELTDISPRPRDVLITAMREAVGIVIGSE